MEEAQYTEEQLEQMLDNARKKKAAARQREERAYIKSRDEAVSAMLKDAKILFDLLSAFKATCHKVMDEQAEKLAEYGGLRSNSKGGFTLKTSDGNLSITRRRDTEPTWDERSTKAIELIKDFLGDTVKKRDKDLYEILLSFLARNENGDLEYARVMNLMQHEDKFRDERWKEGLHLIKQSYGNHLKGYGYVFKEAGKDGKLESITLNFSSL